ncbi:hypothetical protein Fot_29254 [Forsythia ovata]|uniref:Uncharacterized protein n=1 Tax=Forsythia ovata TaxID=205694 RepID=A0ABD1TRV8_9LAMI
MEEQTLVNQPWSPIIANHFSVEVLPNHTNEVLPNLYKEGVSSSGRSYPTPKSEVQHNLHEEGHYRPRGLTSIYQILPRFFKSYLTSTKEVQPNFYEEGQYRPRGPTSIYQIWSTVDEKENGKDWWWDCAVTRFCEGKVEVVFLLTLGNPGRSGSSGWGWIVAVLVGGGDLKI